MPVSPPTSFTELPGNHRRPGRFSLLHMEYGEYMLSDLSVVRFDVPESGSWVQAVRTAGRLKVCTRSLVFEPAAGSRGAPIVRWPLRAMPSPGPRPLELARGSAEASGIDPCTLFCFRSRTAVDLESGGRVGPFVQHDFAASNDAASGLPLFVFMLQHSSVEEFLQLACELHRIDGTRTAFSGDARYQQLLRPILDERLLSADAQVFEM